MKIIILLLLALSLGVFPALADYQVVGVDTNNNVAWNPGAIVVPLLIGCCLAFAAAMVFPVAWWGCRELYRIVFPMIQAKIADAKFERDWKIGLAAEKEWNRKSRENKRKNLAAFRELEAQQKKAKARKAAGL